MRDFKPGWRCDILKSARSACAWLNQAVVPNSNRKSEWQQAREHLAQSCAIWRQLRDNGTLILRCEQTGQGRKGIGCLRTRLAMIVDS